MKKTAHIQPKYKMLLRIVPLLVTLLLFSPGRARAQVQVLFEGFETDGEGVRYVSTGSFTDGQDDYFIRTDGTTGATGIPSYNNYQGSWFWAGEDMDATENTAGVARIEFMPFSIVGHNQLQMSMYIGSGPTPTYDNLDDYLHLQYQIDNGPWQTYMAFENNGAGTNQPLNIDLDLDGIGEGPSLKSELQLMMMNTVSISGSQARIRIDTWMDAAGESVAFDDIRVTLYPVPEPAHFAGLLGLLALMAAYQRRFSLRRGKTTSRA